MDAEESINGSIKDGHCNYLENRCIALILCVPIARSARNTQKIRKSKTCV